MSSDFFYWSGQPVLTELGPITLPFEISVLGLIFGVIAYFGITSYLLQAKAKTDSKSSKRRENPSDNSPETELAWTTNLGIFLGSLIGFTFLFTSLSSHTTDTLGPLLLRWYGLLFALAFLSGYFITRKLYRDAGRNPAEVDTLLMYVVFATVIGARLGEVFFYEFSYYARNPIKILYIWEGGLASHGAAIGILTGLWLYHRKQTKMTFFWLTDRVTLPAIFGGAFIRMGNFFNSEIYGSVTDVSWAVVFARVDFLPRHPTMLYEAIGCIVIFLILLSVYRYYKNHPPEGLLTGIFMMALFSFRFLIEFTKDQTQFSPDFPLGMGQILSIPFVLFGLWLITKKVDWKQSRLPESKA